MGCVILDPFNKLWKESREGRSRRDNNNFNHEDCMMNEYDTKLIKIIADRLSIPVCCMRRVGRDNLCPLKGAHFEENANALAAWSMFFSHGLIRAVFINCHSKKEKNIFMFEWPLKLT